MCALLIDLHDSAGRRARERERARAEGVAVIARSFVRSMTGAESILPRAEEMILPAAALLANFVVAREMKRVPPSSTAANRPISARSPFPPPPSERASECEVGVLATCEVRSGAEEKRREGRASLATHFLSPSPSPSLPPSIPPWLAIESGGRGHLVDHSRQFGLAVPPPRLRRERLSTSVLGCLGSAFGLLSSLPSGRSSKCEGEAGS